MKPKAAAVKVRGVEVVNLQRRYAIRSREILTFVQALKQRLHLAQRGFNICFVDNSAIRQLNLAYRDKDKATDVLSFPWSDGGNQASQALQHDDFADFLGDIVISVETAGRNAAAEGHSTLNEIRWLVLHGLLHLLGFDHERDNGEMVAMELTLRDQLGITGERRTPVKSQTARVRKQRSC